jgi:hypothetical protein
MQHSASHSERAVKFLVLHDMTCNALTRFEAISLVDPKVVQHARLAAQRFSQASPRAMVCKQHGRPLQIVGLPKVMSACSQARCCLACLRTAPHITAWHAAQP